jgi:hypothetical protein
MKDLLGDTFYESHYPQTPGYKARSTSTAAAQRIAHHSGNLRSEVLNAILRAGRDGLTADECAAKLNRNILGIRPRVSELAAQSKIIDSERTRPNTSGIAAIVWIGKL